MTKRTIAIAAIGVFLLFAVPASIFYVFFPLKTAAVVAFFATFTFIPTFKGLFGWMTATTITKSCASCGAILPEHAGVGAKCPACGVLFGEEVVHNSRDKDPRPGEALIAIVSGLIAILAWVEVSKGNHSSIWEDYTYMQAHPEYRLAMYKEDKENQEKEIAAAKSSLQRCKAFNIDNDSLVMDIDGNVYSIIKIGKQVWTKENFRCSKYADGTSIFHVTPRNIWEKIKFGAFCYYDNDSASSVSNGYGALYNWSAVKTEKLAPDGWHIPTIAEWDTLQNYLVAIGDTGMELAKSMSAQINWNEEFRYPGEIYGQSIKFDLSENNGSGFSALPGGWRTFIELNKTDVLPSSGFQELGEEVRWWSTTESDALTAYAFGFNLRNIWRDNYNKGNGFSVRLVRDN